MFADMAALRPAAKHSAQRLGAWLADLALPPTCPITDQRVRCAGQLSGQAWSKLSWITPPWCVRCGFPFPYDQGDGAFCGPCLSRAPVYDHLRCSLAYDDASKPLVLAMKHGGRMEMLSVFGRWMAHAVGDIQFTAPPVIIPVPLHHRRLRHRRYNQSALLAHALANAMGAQLDAISLLRHRATPSQGGLSAQGRARNVAGAFSVRDCAKEKLRGASVVLVDDVFTTGATLTACTRVLKRAGVTSINAVTLARVVRERTSVIS